VAEHPAFPDLCRRLGIVFVGPDAEVMRALGDKIEGKRLAERVGVPVAPWSGRAVDTVEDAMRHAETLGFPLMIKAAAGGGGRGTRRVDRAEDLPNAFERARAEAAQSFGDAGVLMERVVGDARHVEVQLIAERPRNRVGVGGARPRHRGTPERLGSWTGLHPDVALVRAAMELYDDATTSERGRFNAFARRGRPETGAEVRRTFELRYGGVSYRFCVCQIGPQRYLVELGRARIEAELEYVSEHERRIAYGRAAGARPSSG
jgi:Carbamoyl-phosphate synthase L chain, ATP binding domain